jgi:hypothetical protein
LLTTANQPVILTLTGWQNLVATEMSFPANGCFGGTADLQQECRE